MPIDNLNLALVTIEGTELDVLDGASWLPLPGVDSWRTTRPQPESQTIRDVGRRQGQVHGQGDVGSIAVRLASYAPQGQAMGILDRASNDQGQVAVRLRTEDKVLAAAVVDATASILAPGNAVEDNSATDRDGNFPHGGADWYPDLSAVTFADAARHSPFWSAIGLNHALRMGGTDYVLSGLRKRNLVGATGDSPNLPGWYAFVNPVEAGVAAGVYELVNPPLVYGTLADGLIVTAAAGGEEGTAGGVLNRPDLTLTPAGGGLPFPALVNAP